MSNLVSSLNSQTAMLPAGVAVRLPHGQLLGAPTAPLSSVSPTGQAWPGSRADESVRWLKIMLKASCNLRAPCATSLVQSHACCQAIPSIAIRIGGRICCAERSRWRHTHRAKMPRKHSFITTYQMRSMRCGYTRLACIHVLTTAISKTRRPPSRRRKKPSLTTFAAN